MAHLSGDGDGCLPVVSRQQAHLEAHLLQPVDGQVGFGLHLVRDADGADQLICGVAGWCKRRFRKIFLFTQQQWFVLQELTYVAA